MKPFLDDHFLLETKTAERLYHDVAKDLPIIDFHCHLDPKSLAENRRFENLTQIWLDGDHYKWRAMRTAGVDERFITGKDATDEAKYQVWAETVPKTLGNPIYHWTHLELKSPFGIEGQLFGPSTAEEIWHACNEKLAQADFSARGILKQMNVEMVGTTDDPLDDLQHHKNLQSDATNTIDVLPTWRPDRYYQVDQPDFVSNIKRLGEKTDIDIQDVDSLFAALTNQLDHFQNHQCRASDHGIEVMRFSKTYSKAQLNKCLQSRLSGEAINNEESVELTSAILYWLGTEYAKRNWVMQLHMGAQRNNNTRMFNLLGRDAGFDSIGDQPYAKDLSAFLDALDQTDELPKTILYCLNPADNEMIASMIGNFQGGGIAGKIQFGSGWWFNDQKDGMERQIEQLSQLGLLSTFVGMLTDSRSLLSFTRHEYFRRILCNKIGHWVEKGEAPNDTELLHTLIADVCTHNAKRYFNV